MQRVLIALLFLCVCRASVGQTFTYQGRFNDNGEPANGVYDIQVKIFDADTVGNTLITRTFNDQTITNGLFTVEIPTEEPPGTPLFTGAPRWIGVGFRPAGGSIFDPFTFVARQRVTFAPEAAHALRADAADLADVATVALRADVADLADLASVALIADELADPTWDEISGGITYGTGNSRIGINTDGSLGFAALTVNTNTAGQGGMAISTTGANGSPYLHLLSNFGGTIGNGSNAYLSLNGASGVLSIRDDDFQAQLNTSVAGVEVVNDLTVGQTATANDFQYNNAQTRRLSISSSAWRPDRNLNYRLFDTGVGGRSYIAESVAGTASMFVPISLPDGAVIERVDLRYGFIGFGGFSATLWRIGHNGTGLSAIATDSASVLDPPPMLLNADPALSIVDNGVFHYCLEVSSGSWSPSATVNLGGVIVRYRVEEPD